MRRLLVIQLLIIPLLFCFAAPSMVGQIQSTSPQKAVQTQRQSQGFFDYALGKINPSNTDFGATMTNGGMSLSAIQSTISTSGRT